MECFIDEEIEVSIFYFFIIFIMNSIAADVFSFLNFNLIIELRYMVNSAYGKINN